MTEQVRHEATAREIHAEGAYLFIGRAAFHVGDEFAHPIAGAIFAALSAATAEQDREIAEWKRRALDAEGRIANATA